MAQHDRYETDILKALQSIARSLESIDKTLKENAESTNNDIQSEKEDKTGPAKYLILTDFQHEYATVCNYVVKYCTGIYARAEIRDLNRAILLYNDLTNEICSIIYVRVAIANEVRGLEYEKYAFAFHHNRDEQLIEYFGKDKQTEDMDELLDLAYTNAIFSIGVREE